MKPPPVIPHKSDSKKADPSQYPEKEYEETPSTPTTPKDPSPQTSLSATSEDLPTPRQMTRSGRNVKPPKRLDL